MPIPVERLVLFDAVALLNLFVWFARFGYTLDVRAAITCNSVVKKLQVLGGIGAAPKHLAVETSRARPRLASRFLESGDHITKLICPTEETFDKGQDQKTAAVREFLTGPFDCFQLRN